MDPRCGAVNRSLLPQQSASVDIAPTSPQNIRRPLPCHEPRPSLRVSARSVSLPPCSSPFSTAFQASSCRRSPSRIRFTSWQSHSLLQESRIQHAMPAGQLATLSRRDLNRLSHSLPSGRGKSSATNSPARTRCGHRIIMVYWVKLTFYVVPGTV